MENHSFLFRSTAKICSDPPHMAAFWAFLLLLLCGFSGAEMADMGSRKSLDSALQQAAFRAFDKPRTGVVYQAQVPENLTGIKVQVVRLKSGSLFNRGIRFNEFRIDLGVWEDPYAHRLALVYQNLGNWSAQYYDRPGLVFLTPVLGILAYDASDLSAQKKPAELKLNALKRPISIEFGNVSANPNAVFCITFHVNGSVQVSNVSDGHVCNTYHEGHFALMAESSAMSPAQSPVGLLPLTPMPAEHKKSSRTWKIVVSSVLGGVFLLGLSAALVLMMASYRHRARIAKMERQADLEEALQTAPVGTSRAPAAAGTRTQPSIENEYAL